MSTIIEMTNKLAIPTLIDLCSIVLGKPVVSNLVVLGDISISGTIFFHTFAVRAIEIPEFDIKSLSEILGHKNLSFTLNVYGYASCQRKVELSFDSFCHIDYT